MKKIFTLIAAIVSLTAFAQQEVALSPKTMVEEATIASELPMRAANKRFAKPEQSMNARAAKKAMTAADIVGTYLTYNDIYSSSYEYDYSTIAKIVAGEDANTVLITGIYGQSDEYPIKGTVENGQLIIPCNQQINTNETYGMITLGVIAVDETGTALNLYKDEAHPITFDITERGLIPIDSQYGVVRFIPEYSTGNYNLTPYIYDLAFFVQNATMTSEIAKSSTDLSVGETRVSPVSVQIYNGYATVYGFDDNLVSDIYFKTDGTCVVPASKALYYYSASYDYAHAFKATKNSSGSFAYYKNTDPEGTYEGNTITLGMWALYMQNLSSGGYAVLDGRKLNSKIVLDEGELNVKDYSALEGTYKVDAKVVVEGARQGEDLLEAQEISIKQNNYIGYIDVTLPACTSQGFSMEETVVKGVYVYELTPGFYALMGENFPIVIGGKTITASISDFGVLNTNDNTINMTVNATLPDNLGTMTVTYSMSKPKSITVDFSQFEDVDATGSTPIAAKEGVFSFVGNNSKVTLTASGFYTGGNSSSSARHIVVKPETDGILTVEGTASGDNTDRYIFVATAAGADENADNVLNKVAIPEKGVRHSFETELRGGNTYYVCLHGNGTITALSFQPGVITAVNSIVAPAKVNAAKKFIQNGQLIIEKNGQKFNAAGMRM